MRISSSVDTYARAKMTTQERIDSLTAILDAGATQVRHGDRWIQYDLEAVRKERDMLQAQLNAGSNSPFRRVVMTSRG